MKSRLLLILRWLLTILPAAGFILAGIPKVLSADVWVSKFAAWGYSSEFLILIGILEIAGALLFLIPRTMWFGFPMYYFFDEQAQETFNRAIDWFREEEPRPRRNP